MICPPVEPQRPTKIRRVTPPGTRPHRAIFRCQCGKEYEVQEQAVSGGYSKSCGCYRGAQLAWRNVTQPRPKHGHATAKGQSPTYSSWHAMMQRCSNSKVKKYKFYGGRGITVCPEWAASFEAFLADMGERPEGMTLDRIDNDKGYSKENCRWATQAQQYANRRKPAAKADLLPGARRTK